MSYTHYTFAAASLMAAWVALSPAPHPQPRDIFFPQDKAALASRGLRYIHPGNKGKYPKPVPEGW